MGISKIKNWNIIIFLLLSGYFAVTPEGALARPIDRIQHIIVITLENRSFNNIFGFFPGADGVAQAGDAAIQTDRQGVVYKTLPPVRYSGGHIDTRFPTDLPNRPFSIDAYVPQSEKTYDLTHRFYQQQMQINGGKMDRFAAVSSGGALAMGYYDGSKLKLWDYAKHYTLADRFFHAAYGDSFINHFWLICACTPRFENAPAELVVKLDEQGNLLKDGHVTPDGYAVHKLRSAQFPPPSGKKASHLLPPQDMPTIGDRLTEKGVSWAWYAEGWYNMTKGRPSSNFRFHHQPFTYFKAYAEGTEGYARLKSARDFFRDLKNGTLPAVSFYKPMTGTNMHPGSSNLTSSDEHIAGILRAIEQSPQWKDTVVIVTFDENGGFWDHVPPPPGDRWGPANRVPTLIISPFAKKGYIDSTTYDTTSILKLIETRFGLEPLGERDARANDLTNALELE
jgi:acid phosphatase